MTTVIIFENEVFLRRKVHLHWQNDVTNVSVAAVKAALALANWSVQV